MNKTFIPFPYDYHEMEYKIILSFHFSQIRRKKMKVNNLIEWNKLNY